MSYFDQFLMMTRYRPLMATGIAVVIVVGFALTMMFLSATGILQIIVYAVGKTYATIFSLIWNDVLPWPNCGNPTGRRGDLDVCAGVGVVYLPITIIATFAIMCAGAAAIIAIFAKLVSSRR